MGQFEIHLKQLMHWGFRTSSVFEMWMFMEQTRSQLWHWMQVSEFLLIVYSLARFGRANLIPSVQA